MGLLNTFTIVELSSALVAVIGIVSLCCKTNLQQIQRSRCETINCCFGLFKCNRVVDNITENNDDENNEDENNNEESKNDNNV